MEPEMRIELTIFCLLGRRILQTRLHTRQTHQPLCYSGIYYIQRGRWESNPLKFALQANTQPISHFPYNWRAQWDSNPRSTDSSEKQTKYTDPGSFCVGSASTMNTTVTCLKYLFLLRVRCFNWLSHRPTLLNWQPRENLNLRLLVQSQMCLSATLRGYFFRSADNKINIVIEITIKS